MSETPTIDTTQRRTIRQALQDVTNPATTKGAIAVVCGLALMVSPDLSIAIVERVAGLGLLTTGLLDLWYAITGRGERGQNSRLLSLGRGVAGVTVGLVLLIARQETLNLVVVLLALYLVARGLLSLLAGLLGRDSSRRGARLTIGAAALALGILLLAVPRSLADGIIVAGAMVALVIGAILLAYGLRVGAPAASPIDVQSATIAEIIWDWVRASDIGNERRAGLAETMYFENPGRAPKLLAWWVMLLLSVAIATFAVLQDSTAVVIGAMLIAPLMTPILGLAGALVNGWRRRAGSSAMLVALGVIGAVALAYLISDWVPALVGFESNSQVISRVNPTFVDMLIALCAGAAGAFATVNSRLASSIAGVAIAVALVPPLAVVGVSLEQERWSDAFGSFLLFMTNFVSIVLAAAGVFVLAGFAESARLRSNRSQVLSTLAPFGALALVILVPLVFTAEGILATASAESTAQNVVTDWVGQDSRLRVGQVAVDASAEKVTVTVEITGSESLPPPRDLQRELSDALGRPVELVVEFTPSVEINVSENGTVRSDEGSPDPS
jgi:uncharacterized hydrophobic protein (TIGR00271 family)